MIVEIHQFSGIGNSLAVARDIGERTGARLLSIPSVMDRSSVTSDAAAMDLGFPV